MPKDCNYESKGAHPLLVQLKTTQRHPEAVIILQQYALSGIPSLFLSSVSSWRRPCLNFPTQGKLLILDDGFKSSHGGNEKDLIYTSIGVCLYKNVSPLNQYWSDGEGLWRKIEDQHFEADSFCRGSYKRVF